jgi:endonuclease YncB( thermonuclease family)
MRYRVLIVLLVVLLLPGLTFAAEIQGRVVGVHDGDTFTLLQNGNQQTKIRLAEIDAPESKQPYGNKAKQELSSLIFGKVTRKK